MGGSPGQEVIGGDSQSEGHGFESWQHGWTTFFHIDFL